MHVEFASVVIVAAALLFLVAAWWRHWWSRNSRLVVTAPVLLLLVLPVTWEQVRSPGASAPTPGAPMEYVGVQAALRGAGDGEPAAESLVRVDGPGTLYVAFTCRGEGHVELRLGLEPGVSVSQRCVADETREQQEWIDLDRAMEIPVNWVASGEVDHRYVVQLLSPGQDSAAP